MRQRSHYRYNSLMNKVTQKSAVHLPYITYKTIVHLFYRTFHGADYIHIRTRQTECIDTARLQTGNYVLVYQSTIYHCHHFQGFGIGNTAPIYHFAFNTQPGRNFRCRTSATVHQHFITFDSGKIIQQLAESGFFFHNFATHFDYCQFLSHYSKYVYPYKPER